MSPALAVAGTSVASLTFGLVVGLPLNLLIDRLPQIERPAGQKRSRARLLTVMGLNAIAFLLVHLVFGLTWRLPLGWWFAAVMIAIAFIDLEHMIIPNVIVIPGAVVGLAASIALDSGSWWTFAAAAAGAGVFLFVLTFLWRGGMGPGDVKMALLMGAVLGQAVVVALFLSFVVGAAVGIALLATKRRSRKDRIPFGPFLALGSIIALLVGDRLLELYVGLLG